MRIVVDMQGAQSESRYRGIGRYTMSFTHALVRNRGKHEIILALNGLFPDTIEPIRAAFDEILPQENIRVWYAPGPVRDLEPENEGRREVAEVIREAFLASLQPDIIHVSSLFEGFVDDVVSSIGRFDHLAPISVSLYDLIPLINPEKFLDPNPLYKKNYLSKLEHLKKASLYLAISDYTLQECRSHIPGVKQHGINVSTAIENHFQPISLNREDLRNLKEKFSISRPFIFYTGGADDHKNLPRLIEAFAALKPDVRAKYQVVFGGRIPDGNKVMLQQHGASCGLMPDEILFTGYLSEEDLLGLYNICRLMAFPSWHEGFGLPVLEAMKCGAPVICGNRSSLPEVIGLADAMFDPFDVKSISAKMLQALEDEAFRARLQDHGHKRAKIFSWDESAKKAITAFEELHAQRPAALHLTESLSNSDKLIQAITCQSSLQDFDLLKLSKMLAQNFDFGMERQLLVDVSELCQRDSATGVQRVVRSYLHELLASPPKGFRVEPVYANLKHGYRYARNFKNRFFGADQIGGVDEEISWRRGDIFFALDMQHHVQIAHKNFYSLLRSHGVTVKFLVHDLLPIEMPEHFKDSDLKSLHENLLSLVAMSDGAVCVSKATAGSLETWIEKNQITTASNFMVSWVHNGSNICTKRPCIGMLAESKKILKKIAIRHTFLWVSTIEPRKGQEQILDAFEQLWKQGHEINLVFVGQQGWKMEAFTQRLQTHAKSGDKLFWLNGISDEYLEKVYAASTCLIAASLNEGFGLPLIEAARHGLPIIARDIPVFHEVAGECAYYFKGENPSDLANAVTEWIELKKNDEHPKSDGMQCATWKEAAENLKYALIEQNYPKKQILLDISELVQRDVGSGIQRVVRSILKESLANPPRGFRVEPVYATPERGYRYARNYARRLSSIIPDNANDDPMEYAPGDVFLGLDLQPQVVQAQRAFYQTLRNHGVKVRFVIYDLLCVLMPEHFLPGSGEGFAQWLDVVMESDGAICISKAVADDARAWFDKHGAVRQRPFAIDWFHLGADTRHHAPLAGLPEEGETTLQKIALKRSFLTVSTIEPRKGHAQVLAAFERLWSDGIEANLVIVGREGWMVDELCDKIRSHSELNQRLFWLDGVNDEYLEKVYSASTCLIAASYGEGFGLPLIEAAQHGLPILARDIPVFREVAGEHASYFTAKDPKELAKAIETWIIEYRKNTHIKSNGMSHLTWKQSAEKLVNVMQN